MAALIVLALIATALRCAYAVTHTAFSPRADLVAAWCWSWPVLIWMDFDALRLRRRPCFDFGLFLVSTFPLSLAWYCFWTRGWRGIGVLLGLASLLCIPILVSLILSAVLSAQ